MAPPPFFLLPALLVLLLALPLLSHAAHAPSADLVVQHADRVIHAEGHVVRHDLRMTIKNEGQGEAPVRHIHLALQSEREAQQLAMVQWIPTSSSSSASSARILRNTHVYTRYTIPRTKGADSSNSAEHAYLVEVPLQDVADGALLPGKQVKVHLQLIFTNVLEPLPRQIRMGEQQKVLLHASALLFLPYPVRHQKTTIRTGTQAVDSFTQITPSERRNDVVVYGPYTADRARRPFVSAPVAVHYVNNRPFLTATSLQRLLEVSHWGNLAVEEHYEMKHAGAELIGGFHRFEYQRNPAHFAPSSFRAIVAELPATASDIYYRDRIGNISTSTMRPAGSNFLNLELLPRFPLFGGWKTQFYMGYNLPISQFLSHSGKRFQFKAKFASPFPVANVDDLTVRVVIPEGATNIKVHMPFDAEESREITKTYLDTTGRPVVVLHKRNVVNEHNQFFTVTYEFSGSSIIREPLMVVGGLFCFCLFIMVYVRVDLTIGKTKASQEQEKKENAENLAELFVLKQNERTQLYAALERAIKMGNSQTINAVHNDTKEKRAQIESFIRDNIVAHIAKLNKRVTEKIQAVEGREKNKFSIIGSLIEARNGKKTSLIKDLERKYDYATDEIMDLVDDISA